MKGQRSGSVQILPYEPNSASAIAIEVHRLTEHRYMRRLAPHAHVFFELVLVQSGQGRNIVDGLDHPAEPGMVFVLPPGSVHDMRGIADADGWSILFEADGVDENLSMGLTSGRELPGGIMFDLFRQPLLQMTRPIQLSHADLKDIGALVERLREELAVRRHGYDHAARATLRLLLVDLARHASWLQAPAGETRPTLDLVSRVFTDIDRHFRETSTLAQAASRLGYTQGYLTTRLRQLTGRTYGAWIIERRMIESRRLLSATDLSVGDIAQAIGYAEQESFIRRFRARHGLTPASWRENARRPGEEGS